MPRRSKSWRRSKRTAKPVEYMVKMDEGHGFRNPENRLDFYNRMESFLGEHLAAAGQNH